MFAAAFGHKNAVRLLLQNNADVNARNDAGQTALMIAVENGHVEVVRLLLHHAANGRIADMRAHIESLINPYSTGVALALFLALVYHLEYNIFFDGNCG